MRILILLVVIAVAAVAYLSLRSLGEGTEDKSQAGKGCNGDCVSCKEHCSSPVQSKKE